MAKIKLKQVPEHKLGNRPGCHVTTKQLKSAEPFYVAPTGILAHRVRYAHAHFYHGKHSHDAVVYWCGNIGCNATPLAEVPKDRLLCARCEALATQHGEKPAKELCGRHVHIGGLRAVKLCCNGNN